MEESNLSKIRSSVIKYLLIAITPSFLLILQNWRTITYPSLSYDEVFWVSTSLDTKPELYSVFKLFGQNLFLTNYAGSTKGIIYSFVFQFFDSNVYVVRLTSLILAGLGVSFLYFAVSQYNRNIALLSSGILVLNPLIGMHAKYDLGLSSVGFSINCIFIGLTILFLHSKNNRYLVIIMLVSLLGIWNKLIFIWQFNALITFFVILWLLFRRSGVLLNGRHAPEFCSQTTLKIISIGIVANYSLYLLIYFGLKVEGSFKLNLELAYLKLKYFWTSLSGTSYILSAWDFKVEKFSMLLSILNLGLILFIVVKTFLVFRSKFGNLDEIGNEIQVAMLFTSVFLVFAQIIVVENADKPWHMLSIYPQVVLLEAFGLLSLFNSRRIYLKYLSSFLIVSILILSLNVGTKVQDSIKRPAKDSTGWTRLWATSATADFLKWAKSQSNRFLLFDWGFQTQLLLSDSKTPNKYIDLHWEILTTNSFDPGVIKNEDLIVTHGPEASAFPQVRELLFERLENVAVTLCPIRKFSDKDGVQVIEVWRVCKRS